MVVADSLNAVLSEQNRQAVTDSLQNMRTITGAFVAPSQEVGELVANANATVLEMKSLMSHIDQSYASKGGLRDQASQALNDFDRLAKNLVDTNHQLQQVLQENRGGLHEFTQATLTQVSNLVSDMQRFIAGLSRFVASVERDPARLLFGERREGYRPQ
jgi:phospholipid/cholesterol/gamma-HCH transport system substrate-binding protein